jgi:hypothetical protein
VQLALLTTTTYKYVATVPMLTINFALWCTWHILRPKKNVILEILGQIIKEVK